MLLIQILLTAFFLFAILKVFWRHKSGELSAATAAGWALFWMIAMIIVLLPNSTAYFAKLVGIGRGADLVVYLALVAVFFIIFRLMIKIELLNRDITKLTRKISLDKDVIARNEMTKQSRE